jgi:hypothetical protein
MRGRQQSRDTLQLLKATSARNPTAPRRSLTDQVSLLTRCQRTSALGPVTATKYGPDLRNTRRGDDTGQDTYVRFVGPKLNECLQSPGAREQIIVSCLEEVSWMSPSLGSAPARRDPGSYGRTAHSDLGACRASGRRVRRSASPAHSRAGAGAAPNTTLGNAPLSDPAAGAFPNGRTRGSHRALRSVTRSLSRRADRRPAWAWLQPCSCALVSPAGWHKCATRSAVRGTRCRRLPAQKGRPPPQNPRTPRRL